MRFVINSGGQRCLFERTNGVSKRIALLADSAVGEVEVDSEAQDYFDRITGAGATISAEAQTAYNEFVLGCKTDGNWNDMLDFCPALGSNETAGLIKGKRFSSGHSWSYSKKGAPTYAQATGWKGLGTNTALGSGVLGSDLDPAEHGLVIYDRNAFVPTDVWSHGCFDGALDIDFAAFYGDGKIYVQEGDSNVEDYAFIGVAEGYPVFDPLGFLYLSRSRTIFSGGDPLEAPYSFVSMGQRGEYRNGTLCINDNCSTNEVYFMGYNQEGVVGYSSSHFNSFFGIVSLGGLESRYLLLKNRVQTLQAALGRSV